MFKHEYTRSWHTPSMLLESSKERNWIVALAGLKILGELGVLPMDEKLKVQKLPPHPWVPVGVDCVLFVVVHSFCLQNETIV